jgi:ATP diphosphatase
MARLRDPQSGCPWDLDQDFTSLVPHTLEEAYEVAEAAETGDPDALCDELGDLLFQVVFYARIGEENGQFGFDQVADAISDKLIRRHPHVFGDDSVADIAEQTREWERHKAAERRSRNTHGTLAGVSTALPALTRAAKLSRRAARVGFDWPDYHGVLAKIDEELAELRHELENDGTPKRIHDELGDLLFSCVNLARKLKQDPETALRATNRRFETRFGYIEQALEQQGTAIADSDADTLERLWSEAKERDNGSSQT